MGRLGGKTVLRCTYLFRRVHFLDSFLLRGSGVSLESGGKAPVIFCPKNLSALPRSFGNSFNTSRYADRFPRTENLIPISSDEKGTTSGVKASANHLAPSSSTSSVVLLNDLHSLLRPIKLGLWSADSLTYILTASAISRWAVSSNTEGEWEIKSYFTPLSGIPCHTIMIILLLFSYLKSNF